MMEEDKRPPEGNPSGGSVQNENESQLPDGNSETEITAGSGVSAGNVSGEEPAPKVPDTPDKIAAFIRENTQAERLTSKASLRKAPLSLPADEIDSHIQELLSRPEAHVTELKGKKEFFYFSADIMAFNFAQMLLLAEENDIYNTIATMVRFNCKTYPRPTSLDSLSDPPIFLDKQRAKNAIAVMKKRSEYSDIKTVIVSNGAPYYYSEQFMTEVYAQSLAQFAEVDWRNYP
jgi:hypothetical protein